MVLVPAGVRSQVRVESAVLYERYDFAEGFAIGGTPEISSISQMSVPFTVAFPLGDRATLTASGGLVRVEVTPAAGSDAIESVSGPTDTELRLEVQLVPDRLLLVGTGALPSGQGSLDVQQTAVLTVLVRDVLGFSTRSLGSGGHYGGGLAGAVEAGDMAVGFAGTYTQFGSYEPVTGTGRQLEPAGELRLRAGLEGPVGEEGYLRLAGIFSRRGQDRINGEAVVESSNRFAAYLSYNGRVGKGTLLAYAYDLYRAGARFEGAALLPKANLVAAGLEVTLPVARSTRVLPRIEIRRSNQAVGTGDTLEKLGTSIRFGADLRQRLSERAALVIEASGLTGSMVSDLEASTADVGLSGFRAGVRLEVTR
ncbi:MAG: hypothetical protein PVJ02_15915 [Gemmatimonadota bacterium]|jgi:hypothetical protein